MALALTPDPFILPVLILIGVLWWLAPSRDGAIPEGRASGLGALVLAGAVLLVPYAIDHAALQRTDHSSAHAAFFHWVETSFTAAGIVVVGLVAALRPGAFRMATWCAGLTLAILGAASVLFSGPRDRRLVPWAGQRSSADSRSSLWVKWKRVARTEV